MVVPLLSVTVVVVVVGAIPFLGLVAPNITTAIETHLKKCHEDKPLSLLPQIWTDYKRDELANIYQGKGTQKEKQSIYDILFNINASQNNAWEKIKQ